MQSSSQTVTINKRTFNVLQAGCPSCCPTNNVKALKDNINISQIAKHSCSLMDIFYLFSLVGDFYLLKLPITFYRIFAFP